MDFKLGTIMLIGILSLMGCSDANEMSGEMENNSPNEEVSNNDDLDGSSEESSHEPPSLIIHVGEETLNPVLGTYSWSIENDDGTVNGTEADSDAPPELVRTSEPMQVTEDTTIELDFEEQPDSYSIRIWDEDNNIISTSDKVDLSSEGEVIYEVLTHWEQGTASYAFSLIIE